MNAAVHRVRVKLCGFTRPQDVHAAVSAGADAIGFVATKNSRRVIEPARARAIADTLPPFVTTVVLFSDDDAAFVADATRTIRPHFVQFHGTETREFCESFDIPYIKTIGMGDLTSIDATIAKHPNAIAFLLDSNKPGEQGGSGIAFDWAQIPPKLPKPLILAGGLTCDNVALAIRTAQPFAVDVSSGIESAPGIKDAEKMRRFISEVTRVSGDR